MLYKRLLMYFSSKHTIYNESSYSSRANFVCELRKMNITGLSEYMWKRNRKKKIAKMSKQKEYTEKSREIEEESE